jgi:hypothetical protein
MFTFLKYSLLGIIIFVAIGIGWLVLLSVASSNHWGWTISRVNYRLSFAIEVQGKAYTAQTVVLATYWAAPLWQSYIPLHGNTGGGSGSMVTNDAAALRLPGSQVVSLIPHGDYLIGTMRHNVLALANRLLTNDPKVKFDVAPIGPVILAWSAPLVSGAADIPIDQMPPMIVFANGDDPHSAHLFDARDPERWLGPGAKFLGARIEVTSDPPGSNILDVLPWLRGRDRGDPFTTKDDPFAAETHGRNLSLSNFI